MNTLNAATTSRVSTRNEYLWWHYARSRIAMSNNERSNERCIHAVYVQLPVSMRTLFAWLYTTCSCDHN